MPSRPLVEEMSSVQNRLDILISDFSAKEPSLISDLNILKAKVGDLKDRINDAYVSYETYGGGETAPPIETNLEIALEGALNGVLGALGGTLGGARGILAGAVLGISTDILDYMGIDLFQLNKDVTYTQNGGADIVFGASANANYNLGAGSDRFFSRGSSYASSVTGGLGNDIIIGGHSGDILNGDQGDDHIYTGIPGGQASGGANNDRLVGDVGNDVLLGGDGRDLLLGGAGNDVIAANLAANYGTTYADGIIGGGGADIIYGSGGSNAIFGDDASQFSGNLTSPSLIANLNTEANATGYADYNPGGADNIIAGGGNDVVSGGNLNDTIAGGDGNDILYGDSGSDSLVGGLNDDLLFGGIGGDQLIGGEGNDTASYRFSTTRVTVNMAAGVGSGEASGDTYSGIERIEGSAFNDWLIGPNNDSIKELLGGDGNDSLVGGINGIKLYGGMGDDTLFGGRRTSEGYEINDQTRDYLYGQGGNDVYQVSLFSGENERISWSVEFVPDSDIEPVLTINESVDLSLWDTADAIVDTSGLNSVRSYSMAADLFFTFRDADAEAETRSPLPGMPGGSSHFYFDMVVDFVGGTAPPGPEVPNFNGFVSVGYFISGANAYLYSAAQVSDEVVTGTSSSTHTMEFDINPMAVILNYSAGLFDLV